MRKDKYIEHWAIIIGIGVALFATLTRLPLAITIPEISPDGERYITVSKNIIQNMCISISDPQNRLCIPHWGGNHLPGYPGFIAFIWLIVNESIVAITVAQTLIVGAACGRISQTITLATDWIPIGILSGALVSISPIQIAWSRFILPDSLSVAIALFLFAELLLSYHEKCLRPIRTGLLLLAACLLRLDGVILVLPIAFAAFTIHSPVVALKRGVVIALVAAIPLGILVLRNLSHNLPLIPQSGMHDGSPPPQGYLAWGNTWIKTLYQGGQMFYPVSQKNYSDIIIDPDAFTNAQEREEIILLLESLSNFQGQPFPLFIDKKFAEIAREKIASSFFEYRIWLPLQRMAIFWLAPHPSFGWPIELGTQITKQQKATLLGGSFSERWAIFIENYKPLTGKIILFFYRIVLVFTVVFLFSKMLKTAPSPIKFFVINLIIFSLVRTGLLSFQPSIDNRYIISAIAALEIAVPLMLYNCLKPKPLSRFL